MMMTVRWVAAFVLACLCAMPAGTAVLAQPAAPPAVTRTLVDVPGAPEPHTPAEYNRGRAFRYALLGAPAPSTVLVLVPGLNSGPNTMDIISRSLLMQHGPGLEVWITVPRPTLLQDR